MTILGADRTARTLRTGRWVGAAACVAALVAGCTAADEPEETASAEVAAAPNTDASADAAAPGDSSATTTIPFEPGHVPAGWAERAGVACGMDAADLVTQDERFRLEVTGPLATGADGTAHLPVRLEHELGDDVELDFGDDVQVVWAQGDVVVDLDLGWHEGGGPVLQAADAEGLPTDNPASWSDDDGAPALHTMSGLTPVAIATTCWPGGIDEDSGLTSYDEPRPSGEYDVRAVALAMVDGESRVVISDPVAVDWVAPAVD